MTASDPRRTWNSFRALIVLNALFWSIVASAAAIAAAH